MTVEKANIVNTYFPSALWSCEWEYSYSYVVRGKKRLFFSEVRPAKHSKQLVIDWDTLPQK